MGVLHQQFYERIRRERLKISAHVIERWRRQTLIVQPAQRDRHAVLAERSVGPDRAGAGEPQAILPSAQLHGVVRGSLHRRADTLRARPQWADPTLLEVPHSPSKRAGRGETLDDRFVQDARQPIRHADRETTLRDPLAAATGAWRHTVVPWLGSNLGSKLRRARRHSEALRASKHGPCSLRSTGTHRLWSRRPGVRVPSLTLTEPLVNTGVPAVKGSAAGLDRAGWQ